MDPRKKEKKRRKEGSVEEKTDDKGKHGPQQISAKLWSSYRLENAEDGEHHGHHRNGDG